MAPPGVLTLNLNQVPMLVQQPGTGHVQTLFTLPGSSQVRTLLLPNLSVQGATLVSVPPTEAGGRDIEALPGEQYHVVTPDMQTVVPIPVNNDHVQTLLLPMANSSLNPRGQLQTVILSDSSSVLEAGRQVQTLLVPSNGGGNNIQQLQTVLLPVNDSIAESSQQVQTVIVPANSSLPNQGTVLQTVLAPSLNVETQPDQSAHTLVLRDINLAGLGNTLNHIQGVTPTAEAMADPNCHLQVLLATSAANSSEPTQQQEAVVAIPVSELLVSGEPKSSQALGVLADSRSDSNNVLLYLPQEGLIVEVPNGQNEEKARQWYQDSEIACRGLAALRQVLTQLLSFENITLNSPTGTSSQQTFQILPVDIVREERTENAA
ncbi:uncharacterized protein LOC106476951 [Limulus polyphemus]|uniref:Uncharacterized protein LOC106476951 n=1 Tax=Limulus polyphemus TaxID=6850 RepID=A0ABM1C2E6_LIMPO|nr:uncharacterized protein LOC106476951 [Limulus polyphemus]